MKTTAFYRCTTGSQFAEPCCCFFPARVLDSRVATLIVETLRPLTPEVVRHTVARLMTETEGRRVELRRELAAAKQWAALAKRRLQAVDPSHPRVFAELKRDLEEALAHLETVTLKVDTTTKSLPNQLTDADLEQIRGLATDLETLWGAPTTTNEDRKAIVRLLFESAVVRQVDDLFWELQLSWTSGATSIMRFVKPTQVRDYALHLHRQGLTPAEIADLLNAEGLRPRNRKRTFFDAALVKSGLRDRFGLSFNEVLRRRRCIESLVRQELTPEQIVAELDRQGIRNQRGKPYTRAEVRYVVRTMESQPQGRQDSRDPNTSPPTVDTLQHGT